MKVLKFGGSSVANAKTIEQVAAIIASTVENDKCIAVMSAMYGVTDSLIDAGRAAERGDDG